MALEGSVLVYVALGVALLALAGAIMGLAGVRGAHKRIDEALARIRKRKEEIENLRNQLTGVPARPAHGPTRETGQTSPPPEPESVRQPVTRDGMADSATAVGSSTSTPRSWPADRTTPKPAAPFGSEPTGATFSADTVKAVQEVAAEQPEPASASGQTTGVEPGAAGPTPSELQPQPREHEPPVRRDPVRKPVEISDGELVQSRSLDPVAYLYIADDAFGRANVRTNENVRIDDFAFRKWSHWFEFRPEQPNRRYRTIRPAIANWNEAAGRGSFVERGEAEEI